MGDRLVEACGSPARWAAPTSGHLLRTLSAFLREDARTRAELETRQSWTVNAARLAVAAPGPCSPCCPPTPESVAAYSSATGAGCCSSVAVLTAVAYWAMVRIGRLPEDERVLR